jgi:hypothetical protein
MLIREYLTRLWQYTEALVVQFVSVFGFLFGLVYYIIAAYYEPLQGTDQVAIPLIAIVVLPIASFAAWKKERDKREELEEALRSPVDYELSVTVEKINFEIIKENYVVTEQEVQRAHELIRHWQEWRRVQTPEKYEEMLKRGTLPTPEECQQFLDSVDAYHKQLNAFSEEVKNCYTLDFFIKNTGREVDEEIDVHIDYTDSSNNKFKLYKNIEKLHALPRKPMMGKNTMLERGQEMTESILWRVRRAPAPTDKWMKETVFGQSINAEIRKLKAGTGTTLLWEDVIMKTTEQEIEMEYWVASNKTNGVHKKKLPLNLAMAREWGTPIEQ